jgi:hypothetical protein
MGNARSHLPGRMIVSPALGVPHGFPGAARIPHLAARREDDFRLQSVRRESRRPASRVLGRLGAAALVAGLWLGLSAHAVAAQIANLAPFINGDSVRVSFEMTAAFESDVERAIKNGVPVSFQYTVQLKKVRALWINQKLATRRLRTTVVYDHLTERYKLTREIDGQVVATEVVSDPEAMRAFMTRFDNLELFDTELLNAHSEFYLRVRGVIRERNLFLFIPWDIDSGWKKTFFTYVP